MKAFLKDKDLINKDIEGKTIPSRKKSNSFHMMMQNDENQRIDKLSVKSKGNNEPNSDKMKQSPKKYNALSRPITKK